MSLFVSKLKEKRKQPKCINDDSGLVSFRSHNSSEYLSIDRFGSVCTVRISANDIGKNETLALVHKNDSNEENVFYIRSYYGHYLTFDITDNKLYCQKVSYSMTSWRKHTSQVYSKFTSDDLFYFTPSSTAGIIGASGISIYGNNFLSVDSNGTISNKIIPGKSEMWILQYIKRNTSSSPNTSCTDSLKSAASNSKLSKPSAINNIERKDNDDVIDIDSNKFDDKFDDKLFIISNLVRSNSKALDIYKSQIENKTIKVNTMKEWDRMYNRILMKRNQWITHQNELKIDIDDEMELKNDDITRNNNDEIISNDLTKSLNYKYNEKWMELSKLKESMIREKSTLNKLNEGKNATSMILDRCNNAIKQYDDEIDKLQERIIELKQKRLQYENEINKQILPKLNDQTQCIMDKMNDVNELNVKTNNLEKELTSIQETKHEINKFDRDMIFIINYLENKFKNKYIANWINWNTDDIVIWLGYLNNIFRDNQSFKFKNEKNKKLIIDGVKSSNLTGKDLKSINDLILRSYGIKEKEDRNLILKSLKLLMSEMDKNNKNEENDNNNNNNNNDDNKDESEIDDDHERQCVICMDATANMMFMPCNHIALCQNCYTLNTFKKCAFCGNPSNKVIKCYHVGF